MVEVSNLAAKPQDSLQDRLTTHTIPFLAALLSCPVTDVLDMPITIQVFDDKANRRDPSMAKIFHGTLKALAPDLDRRNHQGAGVFISINETDGMGRSKSNIRAYRGWWSDLDAKDAVAAFDPATLPIPPTLLVDSGHGSHVYWLAKWPFLQYAGAPDRESHESTLRGIQRHLADMGADSSVSEIARALRLPGFRNMKREPFPLVTLLMNYTFRYTQEAIREAFSILDAPLQPTQATPRPSYICPGDSAGRAGRIAAYTQILAAATPAVAGQHGHTTTLKVAIKVACGFDLQEEEATAYLVDFYNPYCCPPWNEAELARKVREALRICPHRGWLLH